MQPMVGAGSTRAPFLAMLYAAQADLPHKAPLYAALLDMGSPQNVQ